ncbi:DUF305 domain-containing protein [Nakamurella silvestris]|nr:DUF305 domain-containing protein [Nakamurella silvestris]
MTENVQATPPPSIFQRWGRRGTATVLTACALVLLLIGGTAGLALAPSDDHRALTVPSNDSVDAGFLRDMITHHAQAISMAHAAQENTEDTSLKVFAYDLEYSQTSETGTMVGWLTLWDLPINTFDTPMQWMGGTGTHSGMAMAPVTDGGTTADSSVGADVPIMPGMATNAEMTKLKGLKGKASDIFFLQLMIRHHQGGAPMMQYAADRATNAAVRQLAQRMLNNQTKEIAQMTDWLKTFGEVPLPFSG